LSVTPTIRAATPKDAALILRLGVRRDQPRLVAYYGKMGFELAPGLSYAHANPAAPEPWVMRRVLTRPDWR
jgi:hypothetical protein